MAVLDTTKYLDAVCRMIDEGHTGVPVPIRGDSMRPFLANADFAYLTQLPQQVKRGDIILFQRPGGQYVLHRVYKILPDGSYRMLGDGQLTPEPVEACRCRAFVTHVRCAGQILKPGDLRWWFFAKPWLWLAPWRPQIAKLLALFRKKRTPAQ